MIQQYLGLNKIWPTYIKSHSQCLCRPLIKLFLTFVLPQSPSETTYVAMSSATVGSIYSDAGSTRHRVRHGRIFRVVVNNSDMKKLTEVFSGYPSPVHDRRDQYPRQLDEHKKETKQIIRDLPFRLRAHKLRFGSTTMANGVVKPRQLCSTHKGLRAKLTYDIWDWVQHELDDRIGPFIYPVIMNFQLEPDVENKLRVLESVLEMYHSDFSYEAAAPPGRVPLILQDAMGSKFRYQQNQCPGCYLARIGSDQNVCFALLVGTLARSGPSRLGRDRNHVISSRVRFLQYWLRLHRKGLELIEQAWTLAGEVRDLRRAWKESQMHYIQESVRASLPVNELSGPPVDLDRGSRNTGVLAHPPDTNHSRRPHVDLDRTSWNPETFAPPSDINPPLDPPILTCKQGPVQETGTRMVMASTWAGVQCIVRTVYIRTAQ
ncbi:hypothetical protein BS50DRAFT_28763 [Corynespora cassiicola Philippines]|uniref:Uncharacterized protein n=1 Tax=Corynespora cassiicola Philippines TaxID=1448308 RepID=A0A2T2PBE9_CORCC|nr:hypothetical protein BS50DRAFT_28763 [Corynespora cassiicola Philippines]